MNGLRARLVMAMGAGSVVVPSVNTRLTRTVGLQPIRIGRLSARQARGSSTFRPTNSATPGRGSTSR